MDENTLSNKIDGNTVKKVEVCKEDDTFICELTDYHSLSPYTIGHIANAMVSAGSDAPIYEYTKGFGASAKFITLGRQTNVSLSLSEEEMRYIESFLFLKLPKQKYIVSLDLECENALNMDVYYYIEQLTDTWNVASYARGYKDVSLREKVLMPNYLVNVDAKLCADGWRGYKVIWESIVYECRNLQAEVAQGMAVILKLLIQEECEITSDKMRLS